MRRAQGVPAKNPLKYKIISEKSYFGRSDIKKALVTLDKTLSLGIQMSFTIWFQPCDARYQCDPKKPTVNDHTGALIETTCVPCPNERIFKTVDCCVLASKSTVNMQGEWYMNKDEPLLVEGGHAVSVVGYNDHYVDEHGNVGGFILRNSWADGISFSHGSKAKGSHTAAFYAHMIGEADEDNYCPNAISVRKWEPCGDWKTCTSEMTKISNGGKDQRLKCEDGGRALPKGNCDKSLDYYLVNKTGWDQQGLYVTCFVSEKGESCLPPLTLDDVATIYQPKKWAPNDPQMCGFNFISYATFERFQAFLGQSIVSSASYRRPTRPPPTLIM